MPQWSDCSIFERIHLPAVCVADTHMHTVYYSILYRHPYARNWFLFCRICSWSLEINKYIEFAKYLPTSEKWTACLLKLHAHTFRFQLNAWHHGVIEHLNRIRWREREEEEEAKIKKLTKNKIKEATNIYVTGDGKGCTCYEIHSLACICLIELLEPFSQLMISCVRWSVESDTLTSPAKWYCAISLSFWLSLHHIVTFINNQIGVMGDGDDNMREAGHFFVARDFWTIFSICFCG